MKKMKKTYQTGNLPPEWRCPRCGGHSSDMEADGCPHCGLGKKSSPWATLASILVPFAVCLLVAAVIILLMGGRG